MSNDKLETIVAQYETSGKEIISIIEADFPALKNADEVKTASGFLKEIVVRLRDMETKRKSFTAPLNESLAKINDEFKRIAKPFLEAKAAVNEKITQWHLAEEKRVREENERIAKEELRRQKIQQSHKEKGHQVQEEIYLPQIAKPKNKVGAAHMRKVWTFEITDISQIPRQFLTVDSVQVNEAIRSGRRSIPGLKIFQKASMVAK